MSTALLPLEQQKHVLRKAVPALVVLALSVLILAIPLPIAPESTLSSTLFFCALAAIAIVLMLILRIARKSGSRAFLIWASFGPHLLLLFGILQAAGPISSWEFKGALVLWLIAAATACIWGALHDRAPASGIAGLSAVLAVLLFSELLLRAAPAEHLVKELRALPALTPFDPIPSIYDKAAFRGKVPCKECPENLVRIIAMGGSSTNGIPMHYSSRTYAAELQRLLDERRPGEKYEVLNAGLGGAGIMQVYAALREKLIEELAPDIVTINCWYNDHSFTIGWYSRPGESDKDGYFRSRWLMFLGELPVYKQLRQTKLYALLRYYLVSATKAVTGGSKKGKRSGPSQPRLKPEEFRWTLDEIAALGRKHDFLPVLILEPINRTPALPVALDDNPYYQELVAAAKRHDLPLVDPLAAMADHEREWLFYDFIHPNPHGHQLIAESIFETLFHTGVTARSRTLLEKRAVDLSKPGAANRHLLQLESSVARGTTVVLKARAPYADTPVRLQVEGVAELPLLLGRLEKTFQTFEVPVGSLEDAYPITDLVLTSVPAEQPQYAIGQTGRTSPVPIFARSGGKDFGWTVAIDVDGVRRDFDQRGYNVAILDGLTGTLKDTALFDLFGDKRRTPELIDYLNDLSRFNEGDTPPIVIVAVHTDGAYHTSPALGEALRTLGGSGTLPEPFQSFALIGTPGAAPGSAVEDVGAKLVEIRVGDPKGTGEDLVEIQIVEAAGLL